MTTERLVYVSDSGIGIDKKDLEHVFEPFAAIKKPTYFKGSGLGLSLAKKLVEAQKWQDLGIFRRARVQAPPLCSHCRNRGRRL